MAIKLKLFYAPWSARAKAQDRHVQQIEHDWRGRCTIERIDVEKHEDIAYDYRVSSLPTVIVENDSGIVDQFGDVVPPDELHRCLERCAKLDGRSA